MALTVGDSAPQFSLPASTGKTVTLNDFKGKKVVLYFYPKDDTTGCTKEACGFRDSNWELKQSGIEVLGVSADDLASHDAFRDKYSLNFPLLSDPDKKTIQDYGVWGEREVRGEKVMGIKRMTFVIDEHGKIYKVWNAVLPDNHAAEVYQALKGTQRETTP